MLEELTLMSTARVLLGWRGDCDEACRVRGGATRSDRWLQEYVGEVDESVLLVSVTLQEAMLGVWPARNRAGFN